MNSGLLHSKASLSIFFIIMLMISPLSVSSRQPNSEILRSMNMTDSIFYRISPMNNETNGSNMTTVVKLQLTNGTILNFSSINDAIKAIYNGITNNLMHLTDIVNVSIIPFSNLTIIKQMNISKIEESYYVPAYSLFFSKLSAPEEFNVTDTVGAVYEDEYLHNLYGMKYSKVCLYGKIPQLNITLIDGSQLEFSANDIILLVYLNMSNADIRESIINTLEKVTLYLENAGLREKTKITVIDVNNGLSNTTEYLSTYDQFFFANDFNTSIVRNKTGSFSEFGFTRYPAYVYLRGDLLVWRKSLGSEKQEVITRNLKLMHLYEDMGVFLYVLGYIEAWDLVETRKADLAIHIEDGYGNTTLSVSYVIFDENNNTMRSDEMETEITESGVVRFTISLPNGSRKIALDITLTQQGDVIESIHLEYEIKPAKEAEEKKEEFPWLQVIAVILAIGVILAVGYNAYRRTSKKYVKRRK